MPAPTRRRARRISMLAAATLAFVALIAPAASAGKPSGSSSFTVPDGTYGGTTTATVSNARSGTWVESTCYQAGFPVIYNRLAVDSNGQAVLTLGPTDGYTAGAGGADCTAEAKYWNLKRQRWISLATTTFHVSD